MKVKIFFYSGKYMLVLKGFSITVGNTGWANNKAHSHTKSRNKQKKKKKTGCVHVS